MENAQRGYYEAGSLLVLGPRRAVALAAALIAVRPGIPGHVSRRARCVRESDFRR